MAAAATASVAGTVPAGSLPATAGRASFGGALRSEFTKIRSVRSTYWTLLALVAVTIGMGTLACLGAVARASEVRGPGFDATFRSLVGLIIGQLIIAVLGALTITSEYSTGMIRTSLSVQPRRGTLFAAKAVIFAAVSLAVGLVASFVSFFIGQAILSGKDLNATLSQPHVLRAVLGAGLFLAVSGLLAFGIGAMLRSTAGAISTTIGLLFVATILVNFLPQSWQVNVDKWLPFDAGSQAWTVVTDPGSHMFSAWTGLGVFAAYAAVAMAGGLILFLRRDA